MLDPKKAKKKGFKMKKEQKVLKFIELWDELLEVLSHDVLSLQLMHNIVEYAKVVYNTPTHKDKLTKMIHRYNLYYRDYITMIST